MESAMEAINRYDRIVLIYRDLGYFFVFHSQSTCTSKVQFYLES